MHFFRIFCIFLGLFIRDSFTFEHDFDLIVFSQQWLKSVCIKARIPTRECNIQRNDDWTIHGIWPSRYRQQSPAKCRPDLPFRVIELENIRNELQTKWISAFDKNPEKFWKHEWDKHGTCSTILNSMNTIEKYFQMGLKLNRIYNIKYMLERSNILPGGRYTITQILNALKDVLGVSPQVTCIRGRDKNQYLEEVRICLNKDLMLISCKEHAKETNCSLKKFVEYPDRFSDH